MVKTFKKLIILVVVFLSYLPLSQVEGMNIVMATDYEYVIPTAITMHSVVKNCQGSVSFVIFVTNDVLESPVKTILENFREPGKTDVYLVNADTIEQHPNLKESFEKAKNVVPSNKLIAIRMLFPKIWGTKILPEFSNEKLRNMKHFLWLDSDLIVVDDLSHWYQELLDISNDRQQPIIGSNLMFIEMLPEIQYQEGLQRSYRFWGNDPAFNTKNFVISGGVLFWNLEIVPKLRTISDARTQPVASKTLMQAVDNLLVLKHKNYEIPLFSTEEQIFGELLPAQSYFFPTTFNCRSSYPQEATRILSTTDIISENDKEILGCIASNKVHIWHWDYEKKPWTFYPTERLAQSEKIWWEHFDDFFHEQRKVQYASELGHFFAAVGNITMAQTFMAKDPDSYRNIAIRHGHIWNELNPQEDVNKYIELYRSAIASSGNNPLCFALSKGHFEIARHLVSAENVNKLNKITNRTPLLIAIEKSCLPMVQYLFEQGANIESSCLPNITPIHLASKIGYLPMVECLIEKGSDINISIQGTTPLNLVSSLHIAQYLVAHKANISAEDTARDDYIGEFLKNAKEFKSNISAAIKKNALGYVQYLIDYKIVGADRSIDDKGTTPLMQASYCGYLPIVQYLVEACNANIEANTVNKVTPLHYAAAGGNLSVVKYLVNKRVNIGATTSTGNQPLHNAALNGHLPVVKYFVEECQIDINIKGKDNKTPLEMAKINHHDNVVQYIEGKLQQ